MVSLLSAGYKVSPSLVVLEAVFHHSDVASLGSGLGFTAG